MGRTSRLPCHDCGGPRKEAVPMTAKRKGRDMPVCEPCKQQNRVPVAPWLSRAYREAHLVTT